MTTQNATFSLGKKASILYSGGTDSALAAYLVGQKAEEITLLTFDPGFIFFIENSKKHVELLRHHLGADRVKHEIIPIKPFIDRILFGERKLDFKKYGFNLTALVCLGCRLSMHTMAIIYNLEHGIPVIADGSIRKQSTVPEQLDSFVRRNRRTLWWKYGIRHFSPIYTEDNSDLAMDKIRLSLKPNLKKQFILFDTQATCPFGVPADVYARLFYGELSGPAREVDTFEYSEQKRPLMEAIIGEHFAGKTPGLDELIGHLKTVAAPLPAKWEDIDHA
ncbi:MAG TPA: hypothetical protein PK961_05490 [bacterium]|nr:hypothetical protein [bacterium]